MSSVQQGFHYRIASTYILFNLMNTYINKSNNDDSMQILGVPLLYIPDQEHFLCKNNLNCN